MRARICTLHALPPPEALRLPVGASPHAMKRPFFQCLPVPPPRIYFKIKKYLEAGGIRTHNTNSIQQPMNPRTRTLFSLSPYKPCRNSCHSMTTTADYNLPYVKCVVKCATNAQGQSL